MRKTGINIKNDDYFLVRFYNAKQNNLVVSDDSGVLDACDNSDINISSSKEALEKYKC